MESERQRHYPINTIPLLRAIEKTSKEILLMPLWLIMGAAFSPESRHKILQRDGHECIVCGRTHYLEAAHLNHDRKNPDYDNPDTGVTLCTLHHLQDHLESEGNNGLRPEHNKWAINSLWQRVKQRYSNDEIDSIL